MICSNSFGSVAAARRDRVDEILVAGATGDWPTFPAANCAFCSLTAPMTSVGVSRSCAIRSGFNQMRIA